MFTGTKGGHTLKGHNLMYCNGLTHLQRASQLLYLNNLEDAEDTNMSTVSEHSPKKKTVE